jgi:hypothetical protein
LGRNADSAKKVLLTVDLQNAFNTVDRSALLHEVRRSLPSCAPWADYCYASPPRLLLGGRVLASERGVQQGDPLGPAFFSLAVHSAILEAKAATENAMPGALELVLFYLDDGTVAGTAEGVSHFLHIFRRTMEDRGLSLAPDKCEVIPSAGLSSTVPQNMFEGLTWKPDGHFKLLGAPFGDAAFCASHSAKRAAKAATLLATLADFGHAQGGLHLVRNCGSWCKLVYSARTVPPELHTEALQTFQGDLRKALEQLVGEALPDRSWALAQLGIVHGGLGIRDPVRHAGAAYLGSLAHTRVLCGRMDPHFDPEDGLGALRLRATAELVQAQALDAAAVQNDARRWSQKELSSMLDGAALHQLRSDTAADPWFQAHVALCAVPGAGAWLTAPPTEDGREMDTPLFRIALKRRLRCPVAETDAACPSCGQCLDRWGDHALLCPCGGDRTIRHNAVRNVCFQEAASAAARPELEKAGLLPRRPAEDALPASGGARRPADIWLPRGVHGDAEALDFAATSGMQAGLVRAAHEPGHVFMRYEELKRNHLQTDEQCRAAGVRFTPMILESHGGGWSGKVRGFVDWLARASAAAHHADAAEESLRIAQRISVTLQRENARAVLRRLVPVSSCPGPSGWATAAPDSGTW